MVLELLIAGDHVPFIEFVEVVGRFGTVAPLQNGPLGLKVGVVGGLITIVKDVEFAHCPLEGANE